MALDTRYRPLTYGDVLGQDAAIAVCRQFVIEGKGFHQSYVFCGQHGSGKTTMGRIVARALLCDAPQEGNPCDKCLSCVTLLTPGATHESFEELDAASKSKVADLERIVEEANYGTFSGKRRIYLFDEAHRLSKHALDLLLKPMEDCIEGSEDKRLVCIFCTTDPGKMSATLFSRCAPAFPIRIVEVAKIAERLASICHKEDIKYDLGALTTIVEVTGSHIRDALKTVEGVSMLGEVNRENTFRYLSLGANDLALSILEALTSDLGKAVEVATQLCIDVSPLTAYERLAEAAICSYRMHLGVGGTTSLWDRERLKAVGTLGPALLGIAFRFAAPPHRPTAHTLILDVGTAYYAVANGVAPSQIAELVVGVASTPVVVAPSLLATAIPSPVKVAVPDKISVAVAVPGTVPKDVSSPPAATTPPPQNKGGIWVDPRGIGSGPGSNQVISPPKGEGALDPLVFRELVRHHLRELRGGTRRSG